ncbi:MAG: MBL fold metallo-hydrolase [Bacteroidales bacterium]|nr:MBL fold metallo-hydrolase [Bacteroidales bacterium]
MTISEQKARLTFLGTGTSSGIPMLGCKCEVCHSGDPKDKRLRASALVEYGGLSILVDCGPDFRAQAIRAGITHLDGILLTHNHMDHVGGLDDTRALNLCESHPVNIYCEKYVEDSLRRSYAYAFAEPRYQGAPEWKMHTIDNRPFKVYSNAGDEVLKWEKGFGYHHLPAENVEVKSVEVIPIQGWHLKEKQISVLGYRFGNIAYLTDMNLIEDEEFEKLKGLDAVTINCVKPGPHHSHFSLQECLDFFGRVNARTSYITHLSHLLPCHEEFERMLPENVHPAYDGLTI